MAKIDQESHDEISLRLSREEADFLYDLTCRIGGASHTRRRFADNIRTGLEFLEIRGTARKDIEEGRGKIYFK